MAVTLPPEAAACPACGTSSRRVHSHYQRRLADLPWQGRPVTLRLQARRFRCLDPTCTRQTFAERLPEVAAAGARRTRRLGDLQRCVGMALGGRRAPDRASSHGDQPGHVAADHPRGGPGRHAGSDAPGARGGRLGLAPRPSVMVP
ncbi:transposase family protein [Roseomonas mucosa]